ncbi:transposase [Nonomuraea sp. NPDC050643]|uniref:transposase n=1 Tax=Nonomuraea sp. NPDC050643 TaxID=3155660 RepID=UPI0034089F2E
MEALRGFFTEPQAVLLRLMLANIDRLSEHAALLDAEIEHAMAPFSVQAAQPDEITGVGQVAAQELIAKIGAEISCFPITTHLASWAKFCPQAHESASRKKGNRRLASSLGRIVFSFGKSATFLGERYRSIARHSGKPKSLVAAGNSVLTVICQLLSDSQAHVHDLGADYNDSRTNKDRRARRLAGQLQPRPARRSSSATARPSSSNPKAA